MDPLKPNLRQSLNPI